MVLVYYLSMLDNDEEKDKIIELYKTYLNRLLHTAMIITGDMSLAEDAVHDTFMSIIKHKEKYLYLPRIDFQRAAVIIVKHKSIDLLRKNKKYSDIPIEDMESSLLSKEKPIDLTIIDNETYKEIYQYLDKIDQTSRTILIMKYVEGCSFKEIGEALSMTTSHVNTKIMRAREKMRKLIAKGSDLE